MRMVRWKDYAVYLVVRLVSMIIGTFPPETSRRIMRTLGGIWYEVPARLPECRVPDAWARQRLLRWTAKLCQSSNKLLGKLRAHRERAEGHIRMAFPEFDERRVREVAKGSMEHVAKLAVEVLLTPRVITPWKWAPHVKLRNLGEGVRVLLDRRGCIMLTGHYGNWELLGYTLAVLGFDMVAVMRPLDNEYLNRVLLEKRERSGLRLLYKKGATQSAGDVIQSGGALCFIADQNAGHKGLFVDFFGKKASTYKSIGLLAMEHDVPIIVGCARRISNKFEYEICADRIIRPDEWKQQSDPLMWITQEYTRALEEQIRVAPEQYLWIHRRWKSRPKAEVSADASAATIPSEEEGVPVSNGEEFP